MVGASRGPVAGRNTDRTRARTGAPWISDEGVLGQIDGCSIIAFVRTRKVARAGNGLRRVDALLLGVPTDEIQLVARQVGLPVEMKAKSGSAEAFEGARLESDSVEHDQAIPHQPLS
jgi:hypothetical protein